MHHIIMLNNLYAFMIFIMPNLCKPIACIAKQLFMFRIIFAYRNLNILRMNGRGS